MTIIFYDHNKPYLQLICCWKLPFKVGMFDINKKPLKFCFCFQHTTCLSPTNQQNTHSQRRGVTLTSFRWKLENYLFFLFFFLLFEIPKVEQKTDIIYLIPFTFYKIVYIYSFFSRNETRTYTHSNTQTDTEKDYKFL